jgi:hypothetical protein
MRVWENEERPRPSSIWSTRKILTVVDTKQGIGSSILWSLGVAALIALATVGIDTWLAQLVGIIRDGMPYDGIGYAVAAKALHRALSYGGLHALPRDWFAFAPLWKMLMLLHFGLFGEGLWQAYFVRVWQVFGFVFLTLWMGRRHGGVGFALCMAAVAAALPTISPNAIGVLNYHITGRFDGNYPYLADLRPDMLYSVLLVLAVALLIEGSATLGTSLMFVDGGLAGSAILVKSSTAPFTLCVWGIALAYFAWRQRENRSRVAFLCGWAGAAFLAVVFPWGLSGGFRATVEYLSSAALGTTGVFLYGLQKTSLVQVLSYYWDWFRYHMGVGVIGALTLLTILHLVRPRTLVSTSSWPNVFAYSALAGGLYVIVTAETVKNYFLGLPAYFFAWVLLLILAAGAWRRVVVAESVASFALGGMALILACVLLTYATRLAEASAPQDYRHNLMLVRSLAGDMRRFLSNDDKYLAYWTSDFPGIIDFFMLDRRGERPSETLVNAATTGVLMDPNQKTRSQFIRNALVPARVIVMFDDSIQVAEHAIYVPRGGGAVLQLIRDYLADPVNKMCRYKRYRFERLGGYDSNGGLTAILYAHCDSLVRLNSRQATPISFPGTL